MRSISAALEAAQKGLRLAPAIVCVADESRWGVNILEWTEVYAGSEAAQAHDAAACSDGALVQVRLDGTSPNWYPYRRRVPDPTSSASWAGAAWTQVAETADRNALCCAAADAQGAAYLLWCKTDHKTVRFIKSADNGQSWSAPANGPALAAGYIKGLAAAARPASRDLYLFAAVDAGGAGSDDNLYVAKYTYNTGVWGAFSAWSLAARYELYRGLDVIYNNGDFEIVFCGKDSTAGNPACLWTCLYGDGNRLTAGAWGRLQIVEQSDNNKLIWAAPSLCRPSAVRAGLAVVSTATSAYTEQRLGWHDPRSDFDAVNWHEWLPFDYAQPAGSGAGINAARLVSADGAEDVYLVGPDRAWHARDVSRQADVSARVLAYEYDEDADDSSLVVILDNHDGALADAGAPASAYRALRRGAQLILQRGLRVAGADETAPLPYMVIDDLEWRDAEGHGWLVVRALGWQDCLRRWRAGRLFQWPAASVTLPAAARALANRVGLEVADSGAGSALSASLQPALLVPPGRDGWTAIAGAFQRLPDVLYPDGAGSILYKELASDAPADYAVGGVGEHPCRRLIWRQPTPPANMVDLCGAPEIEGRAFDYAEIARVGLRGALVEDGAFTAAADAAPAAAGRLAKARAAPALAGELEVFPIFGLQLWDVLTLSYARGWAGSRRCRVVCIRERYDGRRRGAYRQIIGVVEES